MLLPYGVQYATQNDRLLLSATTVSQPSIITSLIAPAPGDAPTRAAFMPNLQHVTWNTSDELLFIKSRSPERFLDYVATVDKRTHWDNLDVTKIKEEIESRKWHDAFCTNKNTVRRAKRGATT